MLLRKYSYIQDIEAYSLRIRSKHVLMLFDSCFSGSLFSLVRAAPDDITEKSTLPIRQYITAGTEDEAVPDRSMFKRCLLLGLDGDADLTRDGYITGTELGLYLHDKVIQNTRRAQHPQYGKIRTPELARGDFIFLLASSGAVIDEPAPVSSKAYLSLESNVSAARVSVDGRYVCTTNLSDVEITSGEHRIRVEKVGYEPYVRKIRFEKGRTRDLYVILDPKAPLKGRLYVDTQPDNARVRILNIGRAFNQGIELKSGRYHLEVSAKGYETKKVWINLDEGVDKNVTIHLISHKIKSSLLSIDQQKIPIAISMLNIVNDNFCDINKEFPNSKNADNAQFWIGEIYYRERWYEKAILEYQKVIEKYPKSNEANIAKRKLKEIKP